MGQGALDQLRSSGQRASLPQRQGEQEQVQGTSSVAADDAGRAAGTTTSWWSPWTTAPARHAHTAVQVHLHMLQQNMAESVCVHLHTFTYALGV